MDIDPYAILPLEPVGTDMRGHLFRAEGCEVRYWVSVFETRSPTCLDPRAILHGPYDTLTKARKAGTDRGNLFEISRQVVSHPPHPAHSEVCEVWRPIDGAWYRRSFYSREAYWRRGWRTESHRAEEPTPHRGIDEYIPAIVGDNEEEPEPPWIEDVPPHTEDDLNRLDEMMGG